MLLPDLDAVHRAACRIEPFIHRTPVITSQTINQLLDCEVSFKCENFQRVGAFKMRGAMNAVLSLEDPAVVTGVITHSSGNHAAALARAAQLNNLSCHVVMPENTAGIKQAAVKAYGASITLCAPGMAARQAVTAEIMHENAGLRLVHPFDDYDVIAGQATVTLEFLQQAEGMDVLLVPVGGGGLIGGASIVLNAYRPDAALFGVEPAAVDEAARSLAAGQRLPATGEPTIADGLQAGIGERNFLLLQRGVREIVTVSEQQIRHALRLIFERLKVVVEPSAAVALAGLMAGKIPSRGQHVGVILSGGNIDLDRMRDFI